MRGIDPEHWPDLSDPTLHATLDLWLFPYLSGLSRLKEVTSLDLLAILHDSLGWESVQKLALALPDSIMAPGGTIAIDYTGPVPIASARAQAFYGLETTPTLAGGAAPLQLALLSPAGRPIAVTSDLASFWRTGWADARKDMRGRYPKHEWPEHPWQTTAARRSRTRP